MANDEQMPERIWLIPGSGNDGETVWCDDPAPGVGMDAADAVEYRRSDLCASGQQVRAALEGAVNWLDALLTLVQETSCDPDDPEAFDEVVMAAGMWLSSARAEIERLDRAADKEGHPHISRVRNAREDYGR